MSNTYTTSVNSNTTMDFSLNYYLVDASSNNITLTLPTILGNGNNFIIRRIDNNANFTVNLVSFSGQLIDNNASKIINPNTNLLVNSLNDAWYTNGTNGHEINIAFNQLQGSQSQSYALINNIGYTSLGVFNYNGTAYYGNTPIKLEILYSVDNDATSNINFTVHLQDLTNTNIIATIGPIIETGSSVSFNTQSTTTFSSVPSSNSLIEISGKIALGTTAVRLHSMRMILN